MKTFYTHHNISSKCSEANLLVRIYLEFRIEYVLSMRPFPIVFMYTFSQAIPSVREKSIFPFLGIMLRLVTGCETRALYDSAHHYLSLSCDTSSSYVQVHMTKAGSFIWKPWRSD